MSEAKPRKVSDWINGYLKYTEDTESAKIFHKWVAISTIASALRKKVHLSLGRLKIFPNLYVVLVANPGVARKSQAIDFGNKFVNEITGIETSADAITKEALLQDLESCSQEAIGEDGAVFKYSALSIISKEFESFLGQRAENTKMLVLLTDLFDCSEAPWKYRTKQSGSNTVPSVFLNLLAATTPDSLASQLPPAAIGGGLTSRILFIWASKKEKKVAIPFMTAELMHLRKELLEDLHRIASISGTYTFSHEAKDFWVDWYEGYDELDPNRICTDPSFTGWYSRKPMYIQKVALSCAASDSDELMLEMRHINRAIKLIEEIEVDMGRAFKSVGRSAITSDVATVMEMIKSAGEITERKLLNATWRDIDAQKFDNVMSTALRTGRVERKYSKVIEGKKITGTHYIWIGD
jgi:hypothetical protein